MKAPDYDWGDLIYYIGLMAGGGVGYFGLLHFGVEHHLIRLFAGLVVGVPVGYLLEKQFRGGDSAT